MLFWLCRALGCLCVCDSVCIHEKMLIVEAVFLEQRQSARGTKRKKKQQPE